jgi:transposase-like protein
MAKRSVELGNLVRLNPTTAISRLKKALAATGGNLTWTAEQLGVDVSTLRRWVTKLDRGGELRAAIAEMQRGWTDRRRRPQGYRDAE